MSGSGPSDLAPTRPVRRRDDDEIIDFTRYAPFMLNAVSGAWTRATSAAYRRDFGFGIGEWRVLSIVADDPGATQQRICQTLRMDKSAVSRCLTALLERELLEYDASPTDGRRRSWRLSATGWEVHREVMEVALSWERRMLQGIRPDELQNALRVMGRMLENLETEG